MTDMPDHRGLANFLSRLRVCLDPDLLHAGLVAGLCVMGIAENGAPSGELLEVMAERGRRYREAFERNERRWGWLSEIARGWNWIRRE